MKKQLLLAGGAFVAALVITGCAGVSTQNGGVTTLGPGMNIYTQQSSNALLQPTTGKYEVVKRDVTASAVLKSYFGIVHLGDASYATLKAAALSNAPGATDLADVKLDYAQNNICGINEVTVTLTANAVKF